MKTQPKLFKKKREMTRQKKKQRTSRRQTVRYRPLQFQLLLHLLRLLIMRIVLLLPLLSAVFPLVSQRHQREPSSLQEHRPELLHHLRSQELLLNSLLVLRHRLCNLQFQVGLLSQQFRRLEEALLFLLRHLLHPL